MELLNFFKHFSKLIDIFNDMRPIKSCDNDPRLPERSVIDKCFDNWKNGDSLSSKNKGKINNVPPVT